MTPKEANEKYRSEWHLLNAMKEDAIAQGDKEAAKKYRKMLSRLSDECFDRFSEPDESIVNDEDQVGVILPDETFFHPAFDQRSGRVIWFKDLNDYHNGAILYAVPIKEGE